MTHSSRAIFAIAIGTILPPGQASAHHGFAQSIRGPLDMLRVAAPPEVRVCPRGSHEVTLLRRLPGTALQSQQPGTLLRAPFADRIRCSDDDPG